MDNLESVTDSIVLSFQCPEAGENLIVYALHQHYALEWIVILHDFSVLVPARDRVFAWQLGRRVSGRQSNGTGLGYF